MTWMPRRTFLAALAPVYLVGWSAAQEPLPLPRSLPATPAGKPATATAAPPLLPVGACVTLRIRQVIPCDGLCAAERLLNSLPPLQPGDQFIAEILEHDGGSLPLLGGSVTAVTPPGRFGRPGKVTLELAQLLPRAAGTFDARPWHFQVEDQRFSAAQRRLLATLFALEGLGVGAAVGAQVDRGRIGGVAGGAAVGLLLGIAYASLQPGRPASLEPGDTLRVTVGSTSVKVLPPESPLRLYPAQDPQGRKGRP
jgi:hypothetical protein